MSEDLVYDGYLIPKDSLVVANIWCGCLFTLHLSPLLTFIRKMSRDPAAHKSPELFNPDRFLGPNPEPDPRDIVFGFGRYGKFRTTFFNIF
jgi:cytochrome P450